LIEEEILIRPDLDVERLFTYMGKEIKTLGIDEKEINLCLEERSKEFNVSRIDVGSILCARKTKTPLLTDDYVERLLAEKEGIAPIWTTAFMLGLHHKNMLDFNEFLDDVIRGRCLWLNSKIVSQLRILADRENINAIIDLMEGREINKKIELFLKHALIRKTPTGFDILCKNLIEMIGYLER